MFYFRMRKTWLKRRELFKKRYMGGRSDATGLQGKADKQVERLVSLLYSMKESHSVMLYIFNIQYGKACDLNGFNFI